LRKGQNNGDQRGQLKSMTRMRLRWTLCINGWLILWNTAASAD